MIWDKHHHKLIPLKSLDNYDPDTRENEEYRPLETTETPNSLLEEDMDLKIVHLRNRIIKQRNKNEKKTFLKYGLDKARHKVWQLKKL